MKLKKNVALVMVAAAMLASVPAQADNAPAQPPGGASPQKQGGSGTTEQIKNPTGARAATTIKENLSTKESLSKDGQRGGIFSKKDESRGYKKEWAQQGCTEEAWVELNNQYDKSINMSVDQSAVTDQKIMDVIQNPNQMNIKGFEMLGCNLNSSLDGLRQTVEKAQDLVKAISSGNIRDILNQKLEDAAMSVVKGAVSRAINVVSRHGCEMLNNMLKSKVGFLEGMGEVGYATRALDNFTRDLNQAAVDAAQQGVPQVEAKTGAQQGGN